MNTEIQFANFAMLQQMAAQSRRILRCFYNSLNSPVTNIISSQKVCAIDFTTHKKIICCVCLVILKVDEYIDVKEGSMLL